MKEISFASLDRSLFIFTLQDFDNLGKRKGLRLVGGCQSSFLSLGKASPIITEWSNRNGFGLPRFIDLRTMISAA